MVTNLISSSCVLFCLQPVLGPQGGGGGGAGVRPIKQLVRSHVRSAALLSNVGAELSFQLPRDASSAFKALLSEIDARKDELGINR